MADVPQAVIQATTNLRIREAMLLGSSLEGGWTSPYPVGDSGTSFGPYQMHIGGALTSKGLTPQQAEDAVTATKAMLPDYTAAVQQIPDSEWQNNPQHAAEQAARAAERPAQDYYVTDGQSTLNQKWNEVQAVLKGQNNTTGAPGGGSGSSGGGAPSSWQDIGSIVLGFLTGNPAEIASGAFQITPIKSWMERIGLVIFGALLIMAGIIIFAMPAVKTGAKVATQATVIGKAAGVGSAARAADIERRQGIANQSMALGERKLALQEKREARLAGRA